MHTPNSRLRRRIVRTFAAMVLAGGAIAAGQMAWRQHEQPRRIAAALPAPPDLAGKPATLVQRIQAADTAARSGADPLAAVKDLARLYQANGYSTPAEASWRLLLRERPRDAEAWYDLAALRQTAGDYQGLAQLLEQTVKCAPDYAPAWLRLGDFALKTGDARRARSAYERRLQLVANDPYARLGLARLALQAGDHAAARRHLETLIAAQPDFSSAHNLYAGLLAEVGDRAGAQRERRLGASTARFHEADDPWLNELDTWCFDPRRLAELASIAFQAGRREQARQLLERAVALAPKDPSAYQQLAELLLKSGSPVEARNTLEKYLQLERGAPPMIYVDLAEAHRILRQPAEAFRVVDAGLAVHADAFELYNERGALLSDARQWTDAAQAYRQALALAPNDTDSNYSLGMVLLAIGDKSGAAAAFRRALTMKPSFPPALLQLARLTLDSNQLDAAAKFALPLYESHPDDPEAKRIYATLQLRRGNDASAKHDLESAERAYRSGLEALPDDAELNASLGVLYLTQGRPSDALPCLEKYHAVQPQNPQSALFLGEVYAQTDRIPEAKRILFEGEQLAKRNGNTSTAQYCRQILDAL